MGRVKFDNDDVALRDQILKVLRSSRMSTKKNLAALLQCAAQIRNKMIVELAAKESGLRLSGFVSNEHLELYYALKRGRHDVAYISKGWDDPGFRVGDIIELSKARIGNFQSNIIAFLKFCAVNGVAATFEEKDDAVVIQLDSVIYSDGFNKEVLKQIIHHLNLCIDKANNLFGWQ